jgi:hypothetical protein
MEDVRSISLEAIDLIETRLRGLGIELKPGEDDELYLPLRDTISKIAGYPDYRGN